MDAQTTTQFENLTSRDRFLQNSAFEYFLIITEEPINWAYEIWDRLMVGLLDNDNHVRAITAQILCNLAKSDPDQRILKTFPALLNVTRDERFVTARHALQSLWKVGVAGAEQKKLYLDGLKLRFRECENEKNTTLIRWDITVSLRSVFDVTNDEAIRAEAMRLIDADPDEKNRKKCFAVWKKSIQKQNALG